MSIDSGSAETHHSKDEGVKPSDSLDVTPDSIPADAPTSPLETVIEGLEEQGAPDSPHPIDPETHDVAYTPLEQPSFMRRNARWIGGGAVLAVAATAGALIFGHKGDDKDPDQTRPTTNTSAPTTPSQSPSAETTAPNASPSPSDVPSVAPSEQLSPLEQQKALFEKVTLPSDVMNYDFLNDRVAEPSVLEVYTGVDGGKGLYPDIERSIDEVRSNLGRVTPSDILSTQQLADSLFRGKYTDIIDGKVVSLSADKYFESNLGSPLTPELIKDTFKEAKAGGMSESKALAMLLLSSAKNSTATATEKSLRAEARVAEWNVTNPDKPATPSSLSSSSVAELAFTGRGGNVDPSLVEKYVGAARSKILGEAVPQIDYSSVELLEPHITKVRSADNQSQATLLGATILYKNVGEERTVHLTSIAFVPIEKVMVPKNDKGEFMIKPADKSFIVTTVDDTSFEISL